MVGRCDTPPVERAKKLRGYDDYQVSLGDLMRGERATLGKSLLDVQRELKIKATYIAAIENSDPSAFETPGFVSGYVRSYARYLGLDPERTYKAFCEESGFSFTHGTAPLASIKKSSYSGPAARGPDARDPFANPNTPFIPRGEALISRIEPGALGSSMVLVALIAGIGYGGWTLFQEVQKVQFAPVDQTPGVVSQVDPLAPADSLIADLNAADALPAPSADALDRLYRPQALDVPVLTARDGPIAALDPATVGALATSAPEAQRVLTGSGRPDAPALVSAATGPPGVEANDTPPVQVVEETVLEVVMFAVRPSWVRVRAADGTVLFEKILDSGERYVLPKTEEPPTLRAGNAGSVYFSVNGQNYGPAGRGPSVVKNVSLGADDLTAAFAEADISKDRDLAKIVAEAAAATGGD